MLPMQARPAAAPDAAAASWSAPPPPAPALEIGLRPLRPARGARAADAAARPFEAYLRIGARQHASRCSRRTWTMGQGIYTGVATLRRRGARRRLEPDARRGRRGQPEASTATSPGAAPCRGPAARPRIASSWQRYREGRRAGARHAGRGAAERVGRAGGRDPGREGRAQPSARRAARASAQLADEAARSRRCRLTVEAQGARQLEADRQPEAAPARCRRPRPPAAHDFTIDVRLPGMLTAVDRPSAALRRQGRSRSTPRRPRRSRAWSTWSRSRAALPWWREHLGRDQGPRGAHGRVGRERGRDARQPSELLEHYRGWRSKRGEAAVARKDGDAAERARRGAPSVVEARVRVSLSRPRRAGAAERRRAAGRTACSRSGAATRCPTSTRRWPPDSAGIQPEQVRLHVMMTGGGFGRRATPDADDHRRGGERPPRRSAGGRRSRCSGRARTT